MTTRFANALLRALGRRVDARAPTSRSSPGGTTLPLAQGLRRGWYMLEVAPGIDCIGAALELRADGHEPIHLLLSPKPVVKRVVRLTTSVRSLEIGIRREGATLRHVALVPLTARFAASRLAARLRYGGASPARRARAARRAESAGGEGEGRTSLETLYAEYCRHLERHVRPVDYADWRERYAPGPEALAAIVVPPGAPRVEIVTSGEPSSPDVFGDARAAGLDVAPFDPHAPPSLDRFVLFLDAGTRVEAALLPALLSALTPDTRLCHADNDRLDADGRRTDPSFKPDWNPELLLARDYVGDAFLCRSDHPGCLEAARAGTVAARRALLAAAALELGPGEVVHVPEILSSAGEGAGDEAHDRAALLGELFAARGEAARAIAGPLPGTARVLWSLPDPAPSVEIVVPTRDRAEVLGVCLHSLLALTDYPRYRVTVVDNDSVEPATAALYGALEGDPRVRVLPCPGAFNYSAINNFAVARSEADIVVLLNNDTEILHGGWLEELVRLAARPANGCVGAKLYYSNDLIQHAGVIVGITGVAGHAHRFLPRAADGYEARLKLAQNLTAVTAACLAVRRELYEKLGGLDAEHLAVAYNDVDFCLRVHAAGYRNVWTPAAELYHHESLSRGSDDTPTKRERARREFETMRARWQLDAFDDPAYNPNLTIDHEDFGLSS